ncbi:hypothetical protein NQ317_017366 [Molorchus minor]|uniref:Integrase SAM-like N-terminal domain-containing protein n=1 Tax=Molorchus minor TaxID=1323400 RepID=A0ABQ9JQR6_9CUCU|nr:hypothetical protein NQ317_017366 [Molorchus minor]
MQGLFRNEPHYNTHYLDARSGTERLIFLLGLQMSQYFYRRGIQSVTQRGLIKWLGSKYVGRPNNREVLRVDKRKGLGWSRRKSTELPAVLTTGSGEREESIPTRGNRLNPKGPRDAANSVISNLLPEKSRRQYQNAYQQFKEWCETNKARKISENVLLAYFAEKSKKVKSSTLWAIYSMLKSTLLLKKTWILRNLPRWFHI